MGTRDHSVVRRIARVVGIASLTLVLASGCGDASSSKAKSEKVASTTVEKTEMRFLAQYETFSSDYEACIRKAVRDSGPAEGDRPGPGVDVDDWLAGHIAETQRRAEACIARLPEGGATGYVRPPVLGTYGYPGFVGDAIASSQGMANMTGEPVDVVIH